MAPRDVLLYCLVAGVAVWGCSATEPGGNGKAAISLTIITVSPATADLTVGSTQQFTATGSYSDGSSKSLADSVTWSSSSTSVATISNAAGTKGLATVVGGGSTTITASYATRTSNATLRGIALNGLSVTPPTAQGEAGTTQQFTATGSYSDGSAKNLTDSATWSSSNAAVATISNAAGSKGLATIVGGGSTTITATYNAVSNNANLLAVALNAISISPSSNLNIQVGQTQQFTASAQYSDGRQTAATDSVNWTSTNSGAITIGNVAGSKGLATRGGADTATVVATFKGRTASVKIDLTCEVVVGGQRFENAFGDGGNGVGRILDAGASVVWLDRNAANGATGGAFRSIAKSGGAVTTLASGVGRVNQFVSDSSYVYWMESVDGHATTSYWVKRVPIAGGKVDTLVTQPFSLGGGQRGIALDASSIFYVDGASQGAVIQIPKAGGTATTYGRGKDFAPYDYLALDVSYFYGANWSGARRLQRLSRTGVLDTLFSGGINSNLRIENNTLWWTESGASPERILSMPATGGTATTVVLTIGPTNFALDAAMMYARITQQNNTEFTIDGIYRKPKSGGSATLVVRACALGSGTGENFQVFGLVADAIHVYLTDAGGGATGRARVLRVRK